MMVDWHQQWELFAENFYDGKAHIDLSQFGGEETLLLLPGPGFGDLSHPTTYLMLQLYRHRLETLILDRAKAPGIDDRKSVHISNIDRLTIVDPRELSRGSKSKFQADGGIVSQDLHYVQVLFPSICSSVQ